MHNWLQARQPWHGPRQSESASEAVHTLPRHRPEAAKHTLLLTPKRLREMLSLPPALFLHEPSGRDGWSGDGGWSDVERRDCGEGWTVAGRAAEGSGLGLPAPLAPMPQAGSLLTYTRRTVTSSRSLSVATGLELLATGHRKRPHEREASENGAVPDIPETPTTLSVLCGDASRSSSSLGGASAPSAVSPSSTCTDSPVSVEMVAATSDAKLLDAQPNEPQIKRARSISSCLVTLHFG